MPDPLSFPATPPPDGGWSAPDDTPSGTTHDLARSARPGVVRGDARIGRLWDAIRRTRAEIDARERRGGEIGERFAATIRPREERFTRVVCRLTERLVRHHEDTALAIDRRTLLGLWINENLQSLAGHPFAPRVETDALARRWRRHLGMTEHPLDVPLASLYARQQGEGNRPDPPAGGAPDVPDPAEARADAQGPTRDGAAAGADARGARAGARARADDRTTNRAAGAGAADPTGRLSGGAPDDAERELRGLLARLFRRLARVLHPDREPDETRKRDKHRLMSDCLRARDERDIDTLLSLYAAHVGELSAALGNGDTARLERLLHTQLDALRRRLRQRHAGDALQRMIVERYDSDDRLERERRFASHARALDGEIARFEDLERRVAEPDGLRAALAERRERELDRLSIDELTGMRHD